MSKTARVHFTHFVGEIAVDEFPEGASPLCAESCLNGEALATKGSTH
jgi:hypothetical protein